MKFQELDLAPELLQAIDAVGFTEPTPVQEAVIPQALALHDIRACAQTGTGKTNAFVLPILNRLLRTPTEGRPSVLILVPTRELGTQVTTVVRDMGKFTKIRFAL